MKFLGMMMVMASLGVGYSYSAFAGECEKSFTGNSQSSKNLKEQSAPAASEEQGAKSGTADVKHGNRTKDSDN
jgi:hypothetical protein